MQRFAIRLLAAGLALSLGRLSLLAAQQGNGTRSTRSGVYSAEQAASGQELYSLNCASCHTAASHTGPVFAAKWDGKTLFELYDYVRTAMPKSDPGSLGRREYLLVTVYLLKLNGMPAGAEELPPDSLKLARIKLELKSTDPLH